MAFQQALQASHAVRALFEQASLELGFSIEDVTEFLALWRDQERTVTSAIERLGSNLHVEVSVDEATALVRGVSERRRGARFPLDFQRGP